MQDWGSELFEALKQAGGQAYSNYAVGYNNVVVGEATKRGIPVGNTPGGYGSRKAVNNIGKELGTAVLASSCVSMGLSR